MLFKSSSLWLSLCLLGTVLSAGTLSAQNQQVPSASSPDSASALEKAFFAELSTQGLSFPSERTAKQVTLTIAKASPAEKAGLKDGDELLEVNGKPLKAIEKALEKGGPPPDTKPIQVTVRRKDQFRKRIFTLAPDGSVALRFTGDPPPFPDAYLQYPTLAACAYFDAARDNTSIARAQRTLLQALAKYPPAFLAQNLKDVYVFKELTMDHVAVGGFDGADQQRIYIQSDGGSDPMTYLYLQTTLHHEFAHALLANHAAQFSRKQWEKLNAPTFHYGLGGLEIVRVGFTGSALSEPEAWEEGFARRYGTSGFEEDFACVCECLFRGDPRFWQAVDRVEILNKKVKMAIDFYHSLDATLTEAYFRRLPPLSTGKKDSRSAFTGPVLLNFKGEPPPFPDDYLKPPTSAGAVYLDAVQDRALIARAQRLLTRELAKYPPAFLEQNLTEIYVFKDLTQDKVSVGGFGWAERRRLYIQNDARPEPIAEVYFSLTLHHELAHLLLANHTTKLSQKQWEKSNPPTFHYGVGGLESIRLGSSGSTQLDPASWEKGFARPYGMSDFDEDFACICECLFCGDPRFWQTVDRVEVLNKKVKMAIDFYHSLDDTLTEAYFRRLPPLPSIAPISANP